VDKLVEKLSGLSYEIFAILVPGIFGIIGIFFISSFIQLMFFSTNLESVVFKHLLDFTFETKKVFEPILIMFAIYIVGQFSTAFAKETFDFKLKDTSTWLDRRYNFFASVLWLPDNRKSPNNTLYAPAIVEVSKILNEFKYDIKADNADWSKVYHPASRLLSLIGQKSMVPTYQNKYTLHRTLAFQLSFFSKLLLISSLAHLVYLIPIIGKNFNASCFWFGVALSVLMCFLQVRFCSSFRRFWAEFGSQVCSELKAIYHAKINLLINLAK
jgi:hypothetical protein